MTKTKLFRFLVYTLLILAILYFLSLIDFILQPIGTVITSIALPIIGAGFLFYVTEPLIRLFERLNIKRIFAVILVFIIIILVIAFSVYFLIPMVQDQLTRLSDNAPAFRSWLEEALAWAETNQQYIPDEFNTSVDDIIDQLSGYTQQAIGSIFNAIGAIFNFVVSFVLIPFFLFFMLKDSKKFVPFVTQFFSPKKKDSLERLFASINDSLGSFIQGQMIISFSVGTMLLIGYLIVGLDYALILAIFALFMNVIPYLGPWLSAIPAVLIGFFQDPMTGVWTAVVMIVVQQIEGNLIEPNVMGKVLNVHPLTVVVIMIAAGATIGFIGFILAVPMYAVTKATVTHFYHEYLHHKKASEQYLI